MGFGERNRDVIKKEAFDFFKNIFMETDQERPILRNIGFKTLDDNDKGLLEGNVSEDEIWRAVKGCDSKKEPRPDGFNFGFIKKYWGILKDDMVKAVQYFWESGFISKGCNSSFLTFIPKSKDALGLGDFRPMSLIGCYYKIIAKLLAEIIKKSN